MTTSAAVRLLADASAQLNVAADRAEQLAGDDPLSAGHALAGHIRLLGAALSHAPTATLVGRGSPGIREHVDAAITLLDEVHPLDGPVDLQLWTWRIWELRDLVALIDPAGRPESPGEHHHAG